MMIFLPVSFENVSVSGPAGSYVPPGCPGDGVVCPAGESVVSFARGGGLKASFEKKTPQEKLFFFLR